MKAKHLLLLILLLSVAFSAFGYSRITLERTWLIHANDGDSLDFQGALVLNNSHQRVIAVTAGPGVKQELGEGGTLKLHYKGKMNGSSMWINATAIVDVDYDTSLHSDPPLPSANRSFTNLTMPDAAIEAQARTLAQQNSSLATIRDLVNWVHSSMKYDVSYWGQVVPANEVFRDRRGVCVEYTHLLISMARSLGFDTRYVSGYVYSNSWQPHAWAEIYVPDYGWLPADATFGQVGMLEGTHLAIVKGDDQASVYDVLLSDNNATLEARDQVVSGFFSNDSRQVEVSLYPDNYTYVVTVDIANKRPEYVFGSYEFLADSAYGQQEIGILLLQPYETVRRQYLLNSSHFQEGYTYTLPVSAAFNDARAEKAVIISNPRPAEAAQPQCATALFLFSLASAALFRRR
ncbi:MAG: transglutaminase-like domain-containing protein [Candidatus ainarchaeum sp.]|nr:transglutaminase-like domain-containing protein [Candidatus ainarchaeum sp.]